MQIGANDGVAFDPLHHHVIEREWSGLLVEPIPHLYEQLQKSYAAQRERLQFDRCAVTDEDGTATIYHLQQTDDPDVPVWSDALGSLHRDVVVGHSPEIPDIESRLISTDVPTKTFDTLCRDHDIETFDLLHLDTEGHDLEILRTVDLHRFQPAVIVFEHFHLGAPGLATAREMLATAGYETVTAPVDTLALRPDHALVNGRIDRAWRRAKRIGGPPYFRDKAK